MVFSSYEFLFLFLPLVLAGYYLLPRSTRIFFLTVTSYLFYGWWDYRFCGLMLISTMIDYVAGEGISRAATKAGRKAWMIASIISNLSLLGFFKYYDLFASSLNHGLAALLGAPDEPYLKLLHLTLPVGISFYTFQSMSYAIDLYCGRAKKTRSFMDFACYVSLFPQLVAGPIVRYHELAEQLVERRHSVALASRGAAMFILGFAKKVLVADAMAPLVGLAFDAESPGLVPAWIGVLAYAMQIYFDFSGYSDMAVGLGLLFGFHFPINFNSPYKASSITDFWRRWHISLSNWLRDYLYIPLGGNRISAARTYINLMLVMLLGGLWHGANWTFMVWGGIHGLLLAWERFRGAKSIRYPMLAVIRTFVFVCLAWVPFRAASMSQTRDIWAGMIGLNGAGWSIAWDGSLPLGFMSGLLVIAILIAWFAPNTWRMLRMDEDAEAVPAFGATWPQVIWRTSAVLFIFVFSVGVLMVNSSSPFLYFQF